MINIDSSNFGYQERKKKQIHITTKEPDPSRKKLSQNEILTDL